MSSDQSLGPLIADLKGTELQPEEIEWLQHPQLGGLILFTRNYVSKSQLEELISSIRTLRSGLVICVDHEGGRVQRFRDDFVHLPPMASVSALAKAEGEDVALEASIQLGWLMAIELRALDIDHSFAPVLDIECGISKVIGDRSFGGSPEQVVAFAGAFMQGMESAGMARCGKHFPGHGGVRADSHLELPVDERLLADVEAHDIQAFKLLLSRLDAVMTAHIRFPQIDSEVVSFSRFWLVDYLIGTLGFSGLIISDDLAMKGAAGVASYADRAKHALQAGCDAILCCNEPEGAQEILESLSNRPCDSALTRLRGKSKIPNNDVMDSDQYHAARETAAMLWDRFTHRGTG